jgi:hypothetical protein
MSKILYATLGVSAIAFSAVLTAYGAHLSYEHFGSWLGPLMATAACLLLSIADLVWRKHTVRALVFGVLGLACAVVSGSVVIDRTIAKQVATVQVAKDGNHPRHQAELDRTKTELEVTRAAAYTKETCARPKAVTACRSAKKAEAAARARYTDATNKVVSAGAKVDVDPAAVQMASLLHISPGTYRLIQSVSPGTLLELIAPLLMAFGAHTLQGLLERKAPEKIPTSSKSRKGRRQRPLQKHGTNQHTKPTSVPTSSVGRGKAYDLARLRRDRPDLLQRVDAGEMSANRAMIIAGFRKLKLKLVSSQ